MSKHWDFHPAVTSGAERTFGEKCADLMRHALGTWTFFLGFGVAMTIWISFAGFGLDPSPFFSLNLCFSMLAGLQGSVLLISAKRADRISADLAKYHLEVSEQTHTLLNEIAHVQKHLDNVNAVE